MKKMILFATLMVAFWGFQSCEDPNSVGSGVIPSDDAVQVDSLTFKDFVINSLRDDSLYTGSRSVLFLGNMDKQSLGNATASIYTELSLRDTLPTGANVLDSAVVYLRPTSYSGEKDLVQQFDVLTLQDSIPSNGNILIDTSIPTMQTIATISAKYSTDSIIVKDTLKYPFHLRGTVDATYAQTLFNSLSDVKTTQALQQQLKGIKVQPANNAGNGLYAITSLANASALSGIKFYYKNNDEAKELSLRMGPALDVVTDTTYTAGVYNFNEMSGNYSNTEIVNQFGNYNSQGYDLGAVDASNGIIAQVEFDNLQTSFTGDETINSAELKINVDLTNRLTDTLTLPTALFLAEDFARNSAGEKTGALIGTDGSGLSVVDSSKRYDRSATGFRQRISAGVYTYTFYLPNYIERVKNGEEPTLLYIATSNRGETLSGFTFDSNNDIQLNIKYSKTN